MTLKNRFMLKATPPNTVAITIQWKQSSMKPSTIVYKQPFIQTKIQGL